MAWALMTHTTAATRIMKIRTSKADLKKCDSTAVSVSTPKTLQKEKVNISFICSSKKE